ncbi:MAG: hypothetical protein DLM70_05130 [Chloroflexi bacterium]|nr:MAG: hypothetical protein DLM70_05130 [Chloroflexota bacterium]
MTALPTARPIPAATRAPIPARAYTATLYGTITDAKSHASLAGARVILDDPRHFAITSPYGEYTMKTPAARLFSVTVTMNGYLGTLMAGRILPHHRYHLNFQLRRNTPGKVVAPPPPGIFGSP